MGLSCFSLRIPGNDTNSRQKSASNYAATFIIWGKVKEFLQQFTLFAKYHLQIFFGQPLCHF